MSFLKVEDIFLSVQESIVGFLSRSDWLEERTKIEAIRKIKMLQGHFLAPAFYARDDFLKETLRNVSPTKPQGPSPILI
jgi:hypothetical protein